LTENEDGSFHFVDFETGFLFADYDDPAIPDETFRRTNSESVNLTPGGTFTATRNDHTAQRRGNAPDHRRLPPHRSQR
jgi:hypothetical protein